MSETRKLIVDLKAQDALREWFSKRGDSNDLILKTVSLGDSDVNYEMSQQVENIEILPAPFSMPRIKHKLIYEGDAQNMLGKITAFVRYIDKDGNVWGTYDGGLTFTKSRIPPVLAQGIDFNQLDFGTSPNTAQDITDKEAWVVFLETIPDNYYDSDSTTPQRFKENYDITISNLPDPIEIAAVSTGQADCLINTVNDHGLVNGDIIYISSLNNPLFNKLYSVVVNDAVSFYPNSIIGYQGPISNSVENTKGALVKWNLSRDTTNESFILAKGKFALQGESNGLITIKGKTSGIEKTISFNY